MTGKLPIQEYASSGGVVVGNDGIQVLVLLRPKRLGPAGRPELRLPKGHIEPGEDRQQAAIREVCEEAGLARVEILADLGHLTVEFDWKGKHFIRDESCFLMSVPPGASTAQPEKQFHPQWLTWEEALARMTFAGEREWLRRARAAWNAHIEDTPLPDRS